MKFFCVHYELTDVAKFNIKQNIDGGIISYPLYICLSFVYNFLLTLTYFAIGFAAAAKLTNTDKDFRDEPGGVILFTILCAIELLIIVNLSMNSTIDDEDEILVSGEYGNQNTRRIIHNEVLIGFSKAVPGMAYSYLTSALNLPLILLCAYITYESGYHSHWLLLFLSYTFGLLVLSTILFTTTIVLSMMYDEHNVFTTFNPRIKRVVARV